MMYRKLALLAASCLLSVSAFATTYDDAVDATFKNDADALAPLLAKGLDPNTVTSSEPATAFNACHPQECKQRD